MAITTPDAVPGEVIEAAWGDAVRADLTSLDATRVKKAGDTMTGNLALMSPQQTAPASAARKDYVDTKVDKAGDTMTGDLIVGPFPPFAGQGSELAKDGALLASRTGGSGSITTDPTLFLGRGGTAAGANAFYVSFRANTSSSATPMANVIGSITSPTATTIAYNQTSDKRLKLLTRAVDPAEALDKLGRLEPVNFTWRDDPASGERVGFFAQDAYAYAPEIVAVGYGEPGDEPDPDTGRGGFTPWGIEHSALVPTIVAAIQALTARINALEEATP
jgi:hypothetical protein